MKMNSTQNPFFAINSPLLSRSQIFTFEALSRDHIRSLLIHALADKERGLGNIPVRMTQEALDFLAEISDGDARRALTALEVGVLSAETKPVATPLPTAPPPPTATAKPVSASTIRVESDPIGDILLRALPKYITRPGPRALDDPFHDEQLPSGTEFSDRGRALDSDLPVWTRSPEQRRRVFQPPDR